MTITEFLLARIAEDEVVAQASAPGPWAFSNIESVGGGTIYDPTVAIANVDWDNERVDPHIRRTRPDHEADANGYHIARHNPARVLAECAAKRAIIEQHKDWPVLVESKPSFSESTGDLMSMAYRVGQEMAWLTEREYVKRFGVEAPTTNMILALAAIYADHPDYNPEWAL